MEVIMTNYQKMTPKELVRYYNFIMKYDRLKTTQSISNKGQLYDVTKNITKNEQTDYKPSKP